MNVDPVHTNSAGIEIQTPERTRAAQPQQPPLLPRDTDSGNSPNVEVVTIKSTPAPSVIPEHEVKLQLDTSSDSVVYQVLDKQTGALVLQVPSAQQIRNIQQTQELLQRVASKKEGSL